MDKVLLIDFHNFIWRGSVDFYKKEHIPCSGNFDDPCKHSNSALHCACGASWHPKEQTCYGKLYNIVFNFFRNLRSLIEKLTPDKCFFVSEGYAKHRYELYPEYKANRLIKLGTENKRQIQQESFHKQKDIITNLVKYLPVCFVRAQDYECDDVIATLAYNLRDEDVTIVSNDGDFVQLLQLDLKNLKVFNPLVGKIVEPPAYSVLYFKALNGDKSDNIKGLMGPKTAIKLLSNPEKLKKFMSIEENRANVNINMKLIELQNVPIDQLLFTECSTNWEALLKEFNKMEFNSVTNFDSWNKFKNTFRCLKL